MGEEGPTVTVTETPGLRMIQSVTTSALFGIVGENFLTDFFSDKKRLEFVFFRMEKTLSPTLALLSDPANRQEDDGEDEEEETLFSSNKR